MNRAVIVSIAATLALGPAIARAQRLDNPHGSTIGACATCHRADAWKPAAISKEFRHAPKTFPLEGAHLRTACTACHKSLEFNTAPTACASCHTDVHHGEFGTQCARCHSARTFVDQAAMRRMHELTQFPLRGAHTTVACDACHAPTSSGQAQFVDRPTTCIGCHTTDFNNARAPDHRASQFPPDCTQCHSMNTWTDAKFDHSATRFPLDGAHRTVACSACHGDGVFRGKTMECVGCHQADYTRTTSPPHAASGFPSTCASCHTTASWLTATFDHNATSFPLTGAHKALVCNDCHADNVFKGKSTACVSCHQPQYNTALLPPHQSLGFSTACASCHTTSAWQGGTFDHSTTLFPLTGAHGALSCNQCHADGAYKGKSTLCYSCHQPQYTNANNPPHAASGFPTTCETCHGTASWTTATFDHSATLFPLTGAHKTVACNQCHGDGVFKGKSTLCSSCHQPLYASTNSPPHAASGFPTTCETCHGTNDWTSATFDHSKTLFPLTGAHLAVACSSCHGDGVYKGKSTLCYSCHQPQYTSTNTPPHAASGFPTTCETCHSTSNWTSATFNHNNTRFPLTGAHVSLACSACHGDGVYAGKSTTCVSCHLTDYNGTNNPAHAAAGFPQTCETCHTTSTWSGATFNHDSFFPTSSGPHSGRQCSDCHTNPANYAVFTCTTCHTAATTNPQHSGVSGYTYSSTACYSCHPRGQAG